MAKEGAHELSDLDVFEVSLVGQPANMRKFLVVKNDEEKAKETEVAQSLPEGDKEAIKGAMSILEKVTGAKDFFKQLAKLFSTEKQAKHEEIQEVKIMESTEKKPVDAGLEALTIERDAEKAKLAKAETRIAELEKAERKRRLTEIAKSFEGKIEDNIKYLETLADSLPEDKLQAVIEREGAHAKRIKESGLFVEKGSERPVPASAGAKIEELAKAEVAKSTDKNKITIYDRVVKEHPELYAEYLKETNKVDKMAES